MSSGLMVYPMGGTTTADGTILLAPPFMSVKDKWTSIVERLGRPSMRRSHRSNQVDAPAAAGSCRRGVLSW